MSGGTFQDPGFCCKCLCPVCAVYQAQGTTQPMNLALACCNCWLCFPIGFCFTLCMWDPTQGNPNKQGTTVIVMQGGASPVVVVPAGAPGDIEMAR